MGLFTHGMDGFRVSLDVLQMPQARKLKWNTCECSDLKPPSQIQLLSADLFMLADWLTGQNHLTFRLFYLTFSTYGASTRVYTRVSRARTASTGPPSKDQALLLDNQHNSLESRPAMRTQACCSLAPASLCYTQSRSLSSSYIELCIFRSHYKNIDCHSLIAYRHYNILPYIFTAMESGVTIIQ